jgi:hypothetical protein
MFISLSLFADLPNRARFEKRRNQSRRRGTVRTCTRLLPRPWLSVFHIFVFAGFRIYALLMLRSPRSNASHIHSVANQNLVNRARLIRRFL